MKRGLVPVVGMEDARPPQQVVRRARALHHGRPAGAVGTDLRRLVHMSRE